MKTAFRLMLALSLLIGAAALAPQPTPRALAQDDADAYFRFYVTDDLAACTPTGINLGGFGVEAQVPAGKTLEAEFQLLLNGVVDQSMTNIVPVSGMTSPSPGGLPFVSTPSFPLVVELVYNTYLDGELIYRSVITVNCDEPFVFTTSTLSNGPVVAGCDQLISIPDTAVGGSFVAPAPVYWAPGQLVNPAVTIGAGNTALVLGVDSSGEYYKILWGCQYVWVPVSTMGPNYDAVWQGAPLPTAVVS